MAVKLTLNFVLDRHVGWNQDYFGRVRNYYDTYNQPSSFQSSSFWSTIGSVLANFSAMNSRSEPNMRAHVQAEVRNIQETAEQAKARQEEEEKKRQERVAAGIGGVATVLLSIFLPFGLKHFQDTRKELLEAEGVQNRLKLFTNLGLRPSIEGYIAIPDLGNYYPTAGDLKLVKVQMDWNEKHIQFLKKKVSFAREVVFLSVFALTSAVTLFLGGMFSMRWLRTAAIVGGVATLSIGGFVTTMHCLFDQDIPPPPLNELPPPPYQPPSAPPR